MDFADTVVMGASIGLCATVFTDLVGMLRQGWGATHGFYRLVGRWIAMLPTAGPMQDDIRTAPPHPAEAALGWGAHCVLGMVFGIGFVGLFGPSPAGVSGFLQAVGFGLVTVLVPWLVFQPLFGWGIAVSKAPAPWALRLRGLITHAVFGLGLWLSAVISGIWP